MVLAVLAGCATTKVTPQVAASDEARARPNQIWVYDFTAKPAEASGTTQNNEVGAQTASPLAEQLATGRQLGALIASDLVADIRGMGLSAVAAGPESRPQIGDDVIRGYVVMVDNGGIVQRFIVGFGAGTSEMNTVAEDYLMTQQGLHMLASWTLESSGSKGPGILVPVLMTIAMGNPLGLIIHGGMKIYGEVSGTYTLNGRAKATADTIANQISIRFQHEAG